MHSAVASLIAESDSTHAVREFDVAPEDLDPTADGWTAAGAVVWNPRGRRRSWRPSGAMAGCCPVEAWRPASRSRRPQRGKSVRRPVSMRTSAGRYASRSRCSALARKACGLVRGVRGAHRPDRVRRRPRRARRRDSGHRVVQRATRGHRAVRGRRGVAPGLPTRLTVSRRRRGRRAPRGVRWCAGR